jgi:hypothetical protein
MMKLKKMKYARHVEHMGEMRKQYKTLIEKAERKRSVGRTNVEGNNLLVCVALTL